MDYKRNINFHNLDPAFCRYSWAIFVNTRWQILFADKKGTQNDANYRKLEVPHRQQFFSPEVREKLPAGSQFYFALSPAVTYRLRRRTLVSWWYVSFSFDKVNFRTNCQFTVNIYPFQRKVYFMWAWKWQAAKLPFIFAPLQTTLRYEFVAHFHRHDREVQGMQSAVDLVRTLAHCMSWTTCTSCRAHMYIKWYGANYTLHTL